MKISPFSFCYSVPAKKKKVCRDSSPVASTSKGPTIKEPVLDQSKEREFAVSSHQSSASGWSNISKLTPAQTTFQKEVDEPGL